MSRVQPILDTFQVSLISMGTSEMNFSKCLTLPLKSNVPKILNFARIMYVLYYFSRIYDTLQTSGLKNHLSCPALIASIKN